MSSVVVKLYNVFFKFLLKHRLQNRIQTQPDKFNPFGITSQPEETIDAPNLIFDDGVATKDIHINPNTSLSIRIFLPESALTPPEPASKPRVNNLPKRSDLNRELNRDMEGLNLMANAGVGVYRGYLPANSTRPGRKLPVMLQFHGDGRVSGSNDSVANDIFYRQIAKLCDVIVLTVGYHFESELRSEGRKKRRCGLGETGFGGEGRLGERVPVAEGRRKVGGDLVLVVGVSLGEVLGERVRVAEGRRKGGGWGR